MYVQPAAGGEELVMGVAGNRTTELIIGNLTSSTSYVVSVLAYTVANGPRSIHLTVTTNTDDICEYSRVDRGQGCVQKFCQARGDKLGYGKKRGAGGGAIVHDQCYFSIANLPPPLPPPPPPPPPPPSNK